MGSLPDCVPGKRFGCGRLARSSRVGSRDARRQERSNALRRGLLPAAEVRFPTRNSASSCLACSQMKSHRIHRRLHFRIGHEGAPYEAGALVLCHHDPSGPWKWLALRQTHLGASGHDLRSRRRFLAFLDPLKPYACIMHTNTYANHSEH